MSSTYSTVCFTAARAACLACQESCGSAVLRFGIFDQNWDLLREVANQPEEALSDGLHGASLVKKFW